MSRNGNAVVWMVSGAFLFALMAAMTRFLASDVSWAAVASVGSLLIFVFAVSGALITRSKLVVWKPRTLCFGVWRVAQVCCAASSQ